jgi:hypothetical protein
MLKKFSLIALVIASLLFSLQASAGFREALSALQHKDAELMLTEVEKAVETKNYDGIYLFTATLFNQYRKGMYLGAGHQQELAKLKPAFRFDPSVKALEVPHSEAWSGFITDIQRLELLKQLEQIPESSDKNINSLNQILLNNLKGGGVTPTKFEIPFEIIKTKLDLAFVKIGITNPENYGYSETEGIKNYRKTVGIDKKAGYKILADVLLEDDSLSYMQLDATCLMGDAYLNGEGGFSRDAYQAMLWYKRAYTRGYYSDRNGCAAKGLLSLYRSGDLAHYDADLVSKVAASKGILPHPWEMKNYNLPDLIIKHRQAMTALPVISIQVTSPSYSIDVFSDGLVRYKTIRGMFYDRNNLYLYPFKKFPENTVLGLDEWKIKPKLVKKLLSEIKQLGFYEMPERYYEVCLCDMGETQTETFVVIRDKNIEKITSFSSWVLGKEKRTYYDGERSVFNEEAAILMLLEKYIPTRHLRCGVNVASAEYVACMANEHAVETQAAAWAKLH